MLKKICASVLCLAMLAGCMTGCGSSPSTGSSADPAPADSGEASVAPADDGASTADVGDRGTPIELNFFSLNGDYNTAKGEEARLAVQDAIWEDLGINCEIKMMSSDSFSTDQIAVKVAAGELDAISSNMLLTTWQNFIDKGMLLPLDDMLEAEGQHLLAEVDSKLWDPYRVDGKTYLIPIQAPVPFYCGTWLRMDLFRKYGINEIPTTVSELIEGIKVVCENEPDMIGMTAGHITWIYNSGPLNYHLVDSQGKQTHTNSEGNAMAKYIATSIMPVYWEDEGFRETLQRSVDLYAAGILDPEIFTTTFDHANQLIASDRVVCVGQSYDFQGEADRKAGLYPDEYPVNAGEEQEWVFLTNLVNDINGGATTWQYDYEVGMFIGIVATTKYPDEVMKILDWICASNDNFALACWGVEGKHWNYDEDGKIVRVKDDSGKNVVGGGLGGMEENLLSDWWVPISKGFSFKGTEWSKILEGPPATVTWTNCDSFVNYQYQTDATVRSDMETIAEEAIVNIITGKVGLEEGLDDMVEKLYQAGYEEYYAEKNAQYCKAMGIE